MKILVVSNYRGQHIARPEAQIFIGLAAIGYEITVMTHADAKYIPTFEDAGIMVIKQHPTASNDSSFRVTLEQELTNNTYQILHAFNNKAIANCIAVAKNHDIKLVIYRGAAANMAWWNPVNYFKFFHPRIDRVVCNSDEIRENFSKALGFNSAKAATIQKGHSSEWYQGVEPHKIRAELNIESDQIIFITVANNRKVKGIKVLLDAIGQLPTSLNAQFVIVGDRMDKYKEGKLANVHFIGHRRDALSIVAGCDAFICPSIGSEALTKSVVEAMSLGVVPIISDIAGNRPLVDHKVNGYVFRNRDSKELAATIQEYCSNIDAQKDLANAARVKIDHDLNTSQTVEAYRKFYEETVSNEYILKTRSR